MIKNPEHAQYFEDYDHDNQGFGGLGGAGAEEHEKVKPKPTQEGVVLSLNCDNCGVPNRLTVDWKEVIIISAGRLPPGWKVEQGHIRPDIGCGSCRRLVSPGITPDEAGRWVKAAISAKFVDSRQANALVKQVTGRP